MGITTIFAQINATIAPSQSQKRTSDGGIIFEPVGLRIRAPFSSCRLATQWLLSGVACRGSQYYREASFTGCPNAAVEGA
jgi:hypothetical protein